MKKQFFGVILEAQEKYSFPSREDVVFQQISLITGKSDGTYCLKVSRHKH